MAILKLWMFCFIGVYECCADPVLYIGGFYPLTNAFSSWGAGTLPAAELAVKHINENPNVLPNHTLALINADTQGSPGVATRELIRMLEKPPTKIMFIGPFPSHVTQAVAQTCRWWNIIQVSPAAFAPTLSNRATYPTFFRTRAALDTFNPARIALLNSFNWTRVAIIARHTSYFIETVDVLVSDLQAAGLTSITAEVYQTENQPILEIARIKQLDARVIFVLAYEEHARKIFCQALKHGLTGKRYVWIMHYGNDPRWMDQPTEDGWCSRNDIQQAAEGHLVTSDVTAREDGVQAIPGMTVDEFLVEYREFCRQKNVTAADFYATLTYDAVWSTAMSINGSLPRLAELGGPENFTYENLAMTTIMLEEMYSMAFQGLSGLITYSDTGNIASLKTNIQQLQNGAYVSLAQHSSLTNELVWEYQPVWLGGRVPFDRMQVREKHVRLTPALHYVMLTLALGGIGFSAVFLYFNVTKRKTKLIRMSSPNLNNVVILGCVLGFISLMLYGADADLPHLLVVCHVRMMFLAIGFSLGFGALFAKTWRVFKIFTNKAAKKIVIHDGHLFAMVGGFVALDLIIFILWFSLDPIHLTTLYGDKEIDPEDIDFYILPMKTQCSSTYGHLIQLSFYLTKGILLLFGAFLAWQTHDVSIPALNDSKAIGVAVYNVAVMCCLGVPASFVLPAFNVSTLYGVIACCILIATMLTQCIVFIPKMRMLYIGKVGDLTNTNIGGTSSHANKTISSISKSAICSICKARMAEEHSPETGTSLAC